MKNLLKLSAICVVFSMLFVSCNKEPEKQPVESIAGNVETPSWAKPSEYDMSVSMTGIVKVDLALSFNQAQLLVSNYQPSTGDMVAAFSGSDCIGVGELKDGLYYLYMSGKTDQSIDQVTLRYYSATVKNIFVATETFAFVNDGQIGTYSEPYAPKFAVEKAE